MKNPPAIPTKVWVLVIVLLMAAAAGALAFLQFRQTPGAQARVLQDGQVVDILSLEQPGEHRYEAPGGGYNIVCIQDGAVSVTQADCPDQICVRHAATNLSGDPIVCLPNRLVVEVFAGEASVDGVS